MLRTILLLTGLLTTGLKAQNPTLGDIAFTLYDARGGLDEGDDQFAFVALNPIAGGAQISFRDADPSVPDPATGELMGVFVDLAENEIQWTAPAGGVAAGTIVNITTNNMLTTNIGQVAFLDGTAFGLSINGDSIWAVVGPDRNAPDEFLAVISAQSNFAGTNLVGTGLTSGTAFAIQMGNAQDEAQYTGPRTGLATVADYAPFLADFATQWVESNGGGNDVVADTTAFVTGGTLEVLTLTLNSDSNTSESAGIIAGFGVLSIPAPSQGDTIVTLSSSDETEATVPESVTILDGETSIAFDITAVDDLLSDGDRVVTIIASALNFSSSSADFIVTDDGDNPTVTLSTGDILFTCFNGDSESFGFVALRGIPGGEVIFFTDQEWDDSIDAFGPGEGDVVWTSPPGGLNAGDVVIVSNLNVVDAEAVVTGGGTITQNGFVGLNADAETIYAYQGVAARQPVTFLATIANHTGDSIVNTGLTAGLNALFLDEGADYGEYTSLRSGQAFIRDFAPFIADIGNNWAQDVDGDNIALVCDDTDFLATSPPLIEIVDSGFEGDNFFIQVAQGSPSLVIVSSETLDFATASIVNATVDPNDLSRFLIPSSERNTSRDFFRVELR